MSTLKQRGGMALLLCVAVAACGTNRGYDNNSGSSGSNSSGTSTSSMGSGTGGSSVGAATGVSDAGNAATAGSAGAGTGSSTGNTTASTTSSSMQQGARYGTVQSIDPGTRQDIGVGTLGAAAAGGGMGSPSDKVYRVTVRMDDGSTQSIVLDTMPSSYRVGDRVRYSNGSLQRSSQ